MSYSRAFLSMEFNFLEILQLKKAHLFKMGLDQDLIESLRQFLFFNELNIGNLCIPELIP